jgi:hypothetical protein
LAFTSLVPQTQAADHQRRTGEDGGQPDRGAGGVGGASAGEVEQSEYDRDQRRSHRLAQRSGGGDDAAGAAAPLARHGVHHQPVVGRGEDAEARTAQHQPPHDVGTGRVGWQQRRQDQARRHAGEADGA